MNHFTSTDMRSTTINWGNFIFLYCMLKTEICTTLCELLLHLIGWCCFNPIASPDDRLVGWLYVELSNRFTQTSYLEYGLILELIVCILYLESWTSLGQDSSSFFCTREKTVGTSGHFDLTWYPVLVQHPSLNGVSVDISPDRSKYCLSPGYSVICHQPVYVNVSLM